MHSMRSMAEIFATSRNCLLCAENPHDFVAARVGSFAPDAGEIFS